jgi:hypothetical protein
MAPKHTVVTDRPSRSNDAREVGERHSDVVPKSLSQALQSAALRPGPLPHLSWQESGLRVPDETRAAWMRAYESGFDQAFATCTRGDWLVPLVYASGANDTRLGNALVRFAYEVALGLPETDTEEAFAVLEVAQATLEGTIGKDTCARIASNSVDEAYARFEQDRRFDVYFFGHCAAAVARLAAHVNHALSARDAVEAVHSGVAALRVHAPESEQATLELAAKCIRDALEGHSAAAPRESGRV